ncbi:signal peptidase II [Pelagibius litoralis]|uniref:Lipoprotein signal peptidase n=1 Tax=Pelagibius litoralis TaxID=374515 RepID=A0A967F1D1_9PROT|nr:signal peptidase II [Pelagibius litoralis]NIA71166.1 signal peptidase II [Pelagibius litoralis]
MQRTLGIAAVVLVLDQISKWLILAVVMQPPRRIPVTDFFNLVLTYNTGVSFGLFQGDSPWRPYFLAAIALAVVAGLLIWVRRQPVGLLPYGVGAVVGGAIGNVIDRMHQPGVVDFLDFHLAGWHWPAFNVADSAIVCGVALIIVDGLFEGGRKSKKESGIGR